MDYQWYPGHMTKARRAMQEDLKLVDLIIELLDMRVPLSSRNPDIGELGKNKYRMVILNKADLADPRLQKDWTGWFESQGIRAVTMDSRTRKDLKTVQDTVREVCREKFERDRRRGILNRPVRAMVAGIPNVGKSTFINSFAGRAAAKTGNKPGVTRGNQWIRLSKEVELLDTPGILWPKFEDPAVGEKLAVIGSIRDEVLDKEDLAISLMRLLSGRYPDAVSERYGLVRDPERGYPETLESVARARGCLGRGGEPDTEKAAALILDDYRSGRLGRITLETPPEAEG